MGLYVNKYILLSRGGEEVRGKSERRKWGEGEEVRGKGEGRKWGGGKK